MKKTYLILTALLAFSAAVTNVEAVPMPKATAHTYYNFAQNTPPVSNMDMYVKWEFEPVTDTTGLYAGHYITFQNGAGAYIGLQRNGGNGMKKMIFSMWDVDATSTSAHPIGTCNRFGGEGTGTQCISEFNWVAGREYKLRISGVNQVGTMASWTGTVTDMTTNVVTTIGSIFVDDTKTYHGYGLINPGSTDFLEHYSYQAADVPCASLPRAKVTWRGPYANDNTYVATKATVVYWCDECKNSTDSATVAGTVLQEVGGATARTNPDYTDVWKGFGQAIIPPIVLPSPPVVVKPVVPVTPTPPIVVVKPVVPVTPVKTDDDKSAKPVVPVTPVKTNDDKSAKPVTPAPVNPNVVRDCVFAAILKGNPGNYLPATTVSATNSTYYYRYFPKSNTTLGVSLIDDHVYYIGAYPNNKLQDLGSMALLKTKHACK